MISSYIALTANGRKLNLGMSQNNKNCTHVCKLDEVCLSKGKPDQRVAQCSVGFGIAQDAKNQELIGRVRRRVS
jgi:hypothetical protein